MCVSISCEKENCSETWNGSVFGKVNSAQGKILGANDFFFFSFQNVLMTLEKSYRRELASDIFFQVKRLCNHSDVIFILQISLSFHKQL